MTKYYEKTKADYSRDIDHLVTFNKNGLWIRENLTDGYRIISASNDKDQIKNLTIFNFDKDYNLRDKIYSESADISKKRLVSEKRNYF